MYERDGTIPANIRIFNKIGSAYGFLTDAAYIVDYQEGIEFILAAIRTPMKPSMMATTSTKRSDFPFCTISDRQSMRSSPAAKKQIVRTSAGSCSMTTRDARQKRCASIRTCRLRLSGSTGPRTRQPTAEQEPASSEQTAGSAS
jgi:hypothetical protein